MEISLEHISIMQNLRLTIEQVAKIIGVKKTTLRYWERLFPEFLVPGRTATQRREYTFEDVEMIKLIKQSVENDHLTAEGVRVRLKGMGYEAGLP